MLTLGVISETRKENEWRLPIHPLHFERIDPELRSNIFLERGYGHHFGVSDDHLENLVGGMRSREELLAECDVILLAKPVLQDIGELRTGQVLWGWPHCVQDEKLTQTAIDSKLTLIAFEAMNHWSAEGSFNLHVFHKNNELAGYCSVIHALELIGSTGSYGRRLNAAVIGFGATARGAVTALNAHGIHEVDVLTQRGVTAVSSPIHSARIVNFDNDNIASDAHPKVMHAIVEEDRVPMAGFLAEHDIIVNCVLQDTNKPLMFLDDTDLEKLTPGTLVIDVSCDEAMGFSWAVPTTFLEPTFIVGDNITYYAVDHSPSYLWNSATWEISEALLPHIATVLGGQDAWNESEIVRRAIEIRDGVVQNPNILAFQNREDAYPHNHR